MTIKPTSITRTPAHFEQCEGSGRPADGVQFGNCICPVCRGIAQVDDDGDDGATIAAHDVRVIG